MGETKIEAVLFDAAYTLIFPDYEYILNLLGEYGTWLTITELKKLDIQAKSMTQTEDTVFPWKLYFSTWFKNAGVSEEALPEIFAKLWERHRQKNLWTSLGEDVIETLETLRRRAYRLGVISNSDGGMANLLEEAGIARFFTAVIDSGVVGVRKPDERIFSVGLVQLGVQPAETLFVGDSKEIDFEGARNAGLHALLLDPYQQTGVETKATIRRLSELLEKID